MAAAPKAALYVLARGACPARVGGEDAARAVRAPRLPRNAKIPAAAARAVREEYGSFKDCRKAPVHRWFEYPAGYSYRLVESKMRAEGLRAGSSTVADPFAGSGTTSLAARQYGADSVCTEAHPLVWWVARTKVYDGYDEADIRRELGRITDGARGEASGLDTGGVWPALVYKCFGPENLRLLYLLRERVSAVGDERTRDFLRLGLVATLRLASKAGTGWPYIAPSKHGSRATERDALTAFEARCRMMLGDLREFEALCGGPGAPGAHTLDHHMAAEERAAGGGRRTVHRIVNGDARQFAKHAGSGALDMVITSPPYLNNYDYADRTRLEAFFLGVYSSWGEITRGVRDALMTAATTQVRARDYDVRRTMPAVREASAAVHAELSDIVEKLGAIRAGRGAKKKTYDLMVAGYFEDITAVVGQVLGTLDRGKRFVLVLGDSAPYGVHVRTDELIGRIAVALGFASYEIEVLRARGDKWRTNPQRHHVPLRESIVTVTR